MLASLIHHEPHEGGGFPGGSVNKESVCNAVETACKARDPGSIPGLGRSPGKGNGNPFQLDDAIGPQIVRHNLATKPPPHEGRLPKVKVSKGRAWDLNLGSCNLRVLALNYYPPRAPALSLSDSSWEPCSKDSGLVWCRCAAVIEADSSSRLALLPWPLPGRKLALGRLRMAGPRTYCRPSKSQASVISFGSVRATISSFKS